jgi:hypothetical protein
MGQIAKFCRKPRRASGQEKPESKDVGKREKTVGSYSTIGRISRNEYDGLEWEVNVSKARKLQFLVDTGADMSLIKSIKLVREKKFDLHRSMKVKSIDGSVMQTYGVTEADVKERNFMVQFPFHLVNKQVDHAYDRILGKDFLQRTKANICFASKIITLEAIGRKVTKRMFGITDRLTEWHKKALRLPWKSELVESSVKKREKRAEGLIGKLESTEGIYVACSVTRIKGNKSVTSNLKNRNEGVVMAIPGVKREKVHTRQS